jgi:hypothetical protein
MFELVPAEGACSRGEDHSTRDVREDGVPAATGSCDLMPKSVGRHGRHIWYDPPRSVRRLTEFPVGASSRDREPWAYLAGREPVIRMSTSLLALCCQSGLVFTLATPISARSRSIGSRSLRMSPVLIARFTSARIASHICA